jgi:hypothetical protein
MRNQVRAHARAWPLALSCACVKPFSCSGARSLTLAGLAFSAIDPTATSTTMGLGSCLTAAWTSTTAVYCQASVYVDGTNVASIVASVTVQAAVGTLMGGMSFDGARALPCMLHCPFAVAGFIFPSLL